PRLLERREGLRRALLDRIGDRGEPGRLAVHGEKYDGLRLAAPGFRALFPVPGIDAAPGKKHTASDEHALAADLGLYAEPVGGIERAGRTRDQAALLRP